VSLILIYGIFNAIEEQKPPLFSVVFKAQRGKMAEDYVALKSMEDDCEETDRIEEY
jgi:hypothetical protein